MKVHSRIEHLFGVGLTALVIAGCYASRPVPMTPPPPPPPPPGSQGPPEISIPDPTQDVQYDQLRAAWAKYPTTAGWTRTRTSDAGPNTDVEIKGYRGISKVDPANPPANPVLFAHMVNHGNGMEKKYRLKPSNADEYYVVVDAHVFTGTAPEARWRILEVPTSGHGKIDFVTKNGKTLSGKVTPCIGHNPKKFEETDFWNCVDGDFDHYPLLFARATSLASAGPMELDGAFLEKVFGSRRFSARVNGGDETAWASCSGGCCTLEEF